MPASPRITRTRLRPARTSASSPSSALHCCLRPHNVTRRPFGGSPAIVEPAPRPAHPSGPGPYAGVLGARVHWINAGAADHAGTTVRDATGQSRPGAGARARDPTDANALVPDGWGGHEQSACTAPPPQASPLPRTDGTESLSDS